MPPPRDATPGPNAATAGAPGATVRVRVEPGGEELAQAWVRRFGWTVAAEAPARIELVASADGAAFRPATGPDAAAEPWRLDPTAVRPGRDPLLRAVLGRGRGRAATVVDATTGVGADAFALARAGARVLCFEREAVLVVLLEDARARAAAAGPQAREAAARIEIVHGDARDWVPEAGARPDAAYLDPMYPSGRGRGAARRPLAWLRRLFGPAAEGSGAVDAAAPDAAGAASGAPPDARVQGDEDRALLAWARGIALRRAVVKRPAGAPPLEAGASGSVGGATVRFDLYAPRG